MSSQYASFEEVQRAMEIMCSGQRQYKQLERKFRGTLWRLAILSLSFQNGGIRCTQHELWAKTISVSSLTPVRLNALCTHSSIPKSLAPPQVPQCSKHTYYRPNNLALLCYIGDSLPKTSFSVLVSSPAASQIITFVYKLLAFSPCISALSPSWVQTCRDAGWSRG